ncbi:hypothetical protein R1flu_010136 [Riccia fluitans]|uniref:glucan endo-1,3-beta-D-glucosidase n=1 Tax=Riccia fluitans TaxID=41844 RepID=A0ABD1Z588_9MARC
MNLRRRRILAFVVSFTLTAVLADGAFVGVVYGEAGEGSPSPDQALLLLRANGINQVRIYDTNPRVLAAFANTSLEVVVGITNEELGNVGQSNVTADNWVISNLLMFTPWLNITAISVGSEVLTNAVSLSSVLIPTMRYIHASLVKHGLDSTIKVTTPHSIGVLETSFPPSQGSFNHSYLPMMLPLLNFLQVTGSYLMLNLYPYYSYQSNDHAISLPYALFESNKGIVDSYTQLRYLNLYDALLDAGYSAMNSLNFSQLDIVVSETGWPSAGDVHEGPGPSFVNAAKYNGNLAKRIHNRTGTPLRPSTTASAYIYELFNEVSRTGPSSERNWGLFHANLTPVYRVDITGSGRAVIGNSTNQTWCVAKNGAREADLQEALDYACGVGGANCSAIQPGGVCWMPDTVQAHASFAMNAYYQKEEDDIKTCGFAGVSVLTTMDPSYGPCVFLSNLDISKARSGSIKLTASWFAAALSVTLSMIPTLVFSRTA